MAASSQRKFKVDFDNVVFYVFDNVSIALLKNIIALLKDKTHPPTHMADLFILQKKTKED